LAHSNFVRQLLEPFGSLSRLQDTSDQLLAKKFNDPPARNRTAALRAQFSF
jgi:hypothetical protein